MSVFYSLTADPGFIGVAAGKGVNTCPPWKARKHPVRIFIPHGDLSSRGQRHSSLQTANGGWIFHILICQRKLKVLSFNKITRLWRTCFRCECSDCWNWTAQWGWNNENLQFPSARRCRQSHTSSLPPQCSTTARPQGWWAPPPSPKPSETLAYTCRDRRGENH